MYRFIFGFLSHVSVSVSVCRERFCVAQHGHLETRMMAARVWLSRYSRPGRSVNRPPLPGHGLDKQDLASGNHPIFGAQQIKNVFLTYLLCVCGGGEGEEN